MMPLLQQQRRLLLLPPTPVPLLLLLLLLLCRWCCGDEDGQSDWEAYLAWHGQQVQRAQSGDCSGISYAIYRQRNGFGDDIGAMTGLLKHAYRVKAVYVADGWLIKYLHPILGGWDYNELLRTGGICSSDQSVHYIVKGKVTKNSPIVQLPDAQSAAALERYMPTIRKLLISPRADIAAQIMQVMRASKM